MNKKVCAVIVTFNRLDILTRTVAHIVAQSHPPSYIVIVDNNSSDGTPAYLKTIQNNMIHCVTVETNIGYAGGIAEGFEYALKNWHFDYFWIMDDDSFPEENTLSQLINKIDGSGFDILGSMGYTYRYGKKRKIISPDAIKEADYVLVDGALVRAHVIDKIGAPNEKYFMMCEDYEYCKRMQKYGYKVGVFSLNIVNRLHLGGGGKFTQNTLWRGYYHSRNHMLILKEYFSFQNLLNYLIMQSKLIIAAALWAPDKYRRIKFRVMGIWDGLVGEDGKTLDPTTMKFHYKKKPSQKKLRKVA